MGKIIHQLLNELELFRQLAEGDERAYEIIYHHYNKRLSLFVLKIVRDPLLAQELLQDIFVQVWISRALFAEVKYPSSYLFSMANNKTRDYLRKVASDAGLLDRIALRSTELSNETEELVDFHESAAIVEEAVSGLPEQRRIIYELSRKTGLNHDQIAEQLGLSRQTVKNNLVQALRHIRTFMEQRGGVFSYAIFFLLTKK
jgi:RNA polymerase sigma-70 factor (family 1)